MGGWVELYPVFFFEIWSCVSFAKPLNGTLLKGSTLNVCRNSCRMCEAYVGDLQMAASGNRNLDGSGFALSQNISPNYRRLHFVHFGVNVKYLYCSSQHRERKFSFGCIVLPVHNI